MKVVENYTRASRMSLLQSKYHVLPPIVQANKPSSRGTDYEAFHGSSNVNSLVPTRSSTAHESLESKFLGENMRAGSISTPMRKKRNGWWMSPSDLTIEKERIKSLLHNAPIIEEEKRLVDKREFLQNYQESIAPAAEYPAACPQPPEKPCDTKKESLKYTDKHSQLNMVLEFLLDDGPREAFDAVIENIKEDQTYALIYNHFHFLTMLLDKKFLIASKFVR